MENEIEILIAIIVAYIAFQNFRLAKSKMRLELYKARLKIYNEVREFLDYIEINAEVNSKVAGKLMYNTREALFLFDPSIVKYLKNLHKKAFELIKFGEARNKYAEEYEELVNWFMEERQNSVKLFSEYLRIDKNLIDRLKTLIFPKSEI